jgi:NAD(P)-dependent dehydrogenase (short-subunit alcohol dehydrogenase family)
MKDFGDRVAVVTGAASGIGRAFADRFAAEGMRVVLADVEEDALIRTRDELRAKGATTLAVPTDVANTMDVDALASRTLETFGAVHVVCNNAGVGGDGRRIWEQTLEAWQWVIGVNLWGVIHGIRSFVPILLEQNTEGHVVNTASIAGLISGPFLSPYHATKHAVVTLSESLHCELQLAGAKVRVSVVCPGFVRTRIADSDRNRPPQLGAPAEDGEEQRAGREAFRQLIDAGIPPETVADRVLEAIREERFYVFPHPEMLAAFRTRADHILDQQNPEVSVPPELSEALKF